MNKRQLVSEAVRCTLMAGAATALGYVPIASAASANTPANLGKVTVTGTRIKRTNLETAQPVVRISRQQIQKSGYTDLAQLLGQLPSAGGHAVAGSGVTGTSTIDLRNLGANRNLVLVNGKRWFSDLGGTTNLNTIPTSLIDHIEILQDGASAVYGSDAITGVINIITIKNFKGAEAHAYYGIRNGDGHWDGQVKQYDFTIGAGNKRGNVVFNATYREQNQVLIGDRKYRSVAGEPAYVNGTGATPAGRFALFGPAVSGRTFGQGTCGTYDAASPTATLCNLTLQNAPASPSLQNFRNFKDTDRYNYSNGNSLLFPLKNVTAYVQGHYDLFDNVTFTANAAYIRGEDRRTAVQDGFPIGAFSSKTANGQEIGVAASNPYNPFGAALVANTSDPCIAAGSCIGLATINRVGFEDPRVLSDSVRDYFHIFAGFNGFVNLFNREIDWDVGFAQNRRQLTRMDTGRFDTAKLARALGPISQCTSPCVPANVFGGSSLAGNGSITPAQLNYLSYEPHQIHQSNVRDWTANLSSDVYDLPAGPLGVAIGYERVDNYGYSHPDAVQANGNDLDYNYQPQGGRVVRDAEYAELNIPLLADLPGVDRLSVDVANRWTQFKRSGGLEGQQNQETFVHNSSGRLNISYQPINDLLLRASWAQAFRSPTVPDLFGGQTNPFVAFTDPCAAGPNGGYTGGALPSNCPGGNVDTQPNPSINAVAGSNPDLEPEKAISRTVGFVYSPSQVPGLDINADYYKIELNNTISSIGFQNIVNGCFENSTFCNLLTVQGNHITSIRNVSTNVASLLTEGIDVGVHYKFPSTPIGDFDAYISGTFLKVYDSTQINRATKTGFATSHLAGTGNRQKRRFNGSLDWDYGNWSAQYRIQYIGSVVDTCSVSLAGYCSLPNATADYQGTPDQVSLGRSRLGATVYHDVNVAYTVPSLNTTFSLGVNNLFDKTPPINGGGGYDLSTYRYPSRLVYGDIRVRF